MQSRGELDLQARRTRRGACLPVLLAQLRRRSNVACNAAHVLRSALTSTPAPVCCRCQADAKKRKQRLQSILEQQRKLGHFEASRECSALLADAEPPRKKLHAGKHGASGGTPSCAAAY